jgi:hypothetical protein
VYIRDDCDRLELGRAGKIDDMAASYHLRKFRTCRLARVYEAHSSPSLSTVPDDDRFYFVRFDHCRNGEKVSASTVPVDSGRIFHETIS